MAEPAAKVKVTVNLPQSDIDALRKMADQKGITMTEALRRAIAMDQFIEEAMAQGGNLLIEDRDKTVRQILVR